MNGSLNNKGNRVGVILKGSSDIILEYSLKFNFKVTNSQVGYEELVIGLQLAKEIAA